MSLLPKLGRFLRRRTDENLDVLESFASELNREQIRRCQPILTEGEITYRLGVASSLIEKDARTRARRRKIGGMVFTSLWFIMIPALFAFAGHAYQSHAPRTKARTNKPALSMDTASPKNLSSEQQEIDSTAKSDDGDSKFLSEIGGVEGLVLAGTALVVTIGLFIFAIQGIAAREELRQILDKAQDEVDKVRKARNSLDSLLMYVPSEITMIRNNVTSLLKAAERNSEESILFRFYDTVRQVKGNSEYMILAESKLCPLFVIDEHAERYGHDPSGDRKKRSTIMRCFAIFHCSKIYRGGYFYQGFNLEKAIEYFTVAIELDPTNYRAKNDFGMMLLSVNEQAGPLASRYHQQAVEVLEEVKTVTKGKYQRTLLNLAWAYCVLKKFEAAVKIFQDNPKISDLRFEYGEEDDDVMCKSRPGTVAINKACVYAKASEALDSDDLMEKSSRSLKEAIRIRTREVMRIICEESKKEGDRFVGDLASLLQSPKYGIEALEIVGTIQDEYKAKYPIES